MPYRIIKVHFKKSKTSHENDIDRVLLFNGEEELVKDIIGYINDDVNYYFVAPNRIKGYIDVVYADNGNYIKTRHNKRLNGFNLTRLPCIK